MTPAVPQGPLTTRTLRFEIHSFWHPGSGRGDSALTDAAVHRTPEGLPFLPGRTVKGLVREAAELAVTAGFLTASEVEDAFGTSLPPVDADKRVGPLEEARYATRPGSLRFTSACLGRTPEAREAWQAFAKAEPLAREALFRRFASTRIDPNGIARDATLRAIEIAVPMTLYAPIDGPEDAPWGALEDAVRLFIRGIGSGRNRGLGRVTVELEGP